MKFKITLIIIIFLGSISLISMVGQSTRSEMAITGEWKQVSWEYEGEENHGYPEQSHGSFQESLSETHIAEKRLKEEKITEELGQEFHRHINEYWVIRPDGTVSLNDETMLNWSLKGRGHILVLQEDATTRETYQISRLTEDELVLHFNVDLQARGVAKLTFRKNKT